MASDLLEASHGSSAHVRHGVLHAGHGNVTIESITYNNQHEQAQQRRYTLLESLDFPERAQRERTIRNAHRDTGRWFLRTEQYLNWQPSGQARLPNDDRPSNDRSDDESEDSQEPTRCCGIFPKAKKAPRTAPRSYKRTVRQVPSPERSVQPDWRQRLLWIKGNAGAGKSTLLKMVVNHDRTTHTQALILPHFFNARGTLLEHSTIGMYRTLICWLLEHQPQELAAKLDPSGTRARQGWEIPELERLLNEAMGIIDHPSVVFYIDALDECDEAQVRDMLEYFRSLVKTAWDAGRDVRVCFASRPYPHITFEDAVFLDLSQQQEHTQDIETYINDRLRIEESILAAEIRRKLLNKAAGVFMWAVLVIEMLNQACDEGRVERLPEMLEEIPPGLHELFAYTLERYPEDRDATLVCFRWVLFSNNSMTPSQIWWAIQLGLGLDDRQIQGDYQRMSEAAMKRYTVSISKGFVEFKMASDIVEWRAQFVHESVRDFLLNEGALQKLYGSRDRTDFTGQSHELLRDWLTAELVVRRPRLIKAVDKRAGNILTAEDLVNIGWCKVVQEARPGWKAFHYEHRKVYEGAAASRRSQPTNVVHSRGRLLPMIKETEDHKTWFPLAWFASIAIWEQIEGAQQCGRDQKAYLDDIPNRFGPYLLGDRRYHNDGYSIYCDNISPLLLNNCAAVIRQTQLESAQLARRVGQAFGLIDGKSRESPLAIARYTEKKSVLALVDIYLQLAPQNPDLKQLLRYLAGLAQRTRSVGFSSVFRVDHGPLLDLAREDANLACFFVLVLASPMVLSHLDTLKQMVHSVTDPEFLFIKILLYFVEHDLHTDGLDYSCEDTLNWALETKALSEKDLKGLGSLHKEEDIGFEVLSGHVSRLVALLRARNPSHLHVPGP